MKKTTFLLFCAFVMSWTLSARSVENNEATIVCRNFLTAKNVNPICTLVKTEYKDNIPVYHIFQTEKQGFVIISASDFFDPIVAYSFESDFVSNPAVDFTMDIYAKLIAYCEKNQVAYTDEVAERWHYYLENDFTPQLNRAVVVTPLLSTNWNQDKFHNTYCPWDVQAGSGYDYRVPAGCVAIAIDRKSTRLNSSHQINSYAV